MRRLSSRLTFLYKRVIPTIWFGVIAAGLFLPVVIPSAQPDVVGPPAAVYFAFAVLMGVGVYVFFKNLVFDLADVALDDGDTLVVKKGGRDDRIALSDIKNVNYTVWFQPPRVTLSLRKPSIFGEEVSFCPPASFIPFSGHPVIYEWIERVDAAREARSRSMQHQTRGSS